MKTDKQQGTDPRPDSTSRHHDAKASSAGEGDLGLSSIQRSNALDDMQAESRLLPSALQMVRLITRLDSSILALRSAVPCSKPWQRQLLAALQEAETQVQLLRMVEVMEKSDLLFAETAGNVSKACRRVSLAVQGSRADASIKSVAQSTAGLADTLCRLVAAAGSFDEEAY